MTRASRYRAAGVLAASLVALESCNDGLLHAPASALTGSVSMTAIVDASRGGSGEAFDRADRLFVQFRAGTDVRTEQEMPFSASSGRAVVRLEIPLREVSELMTADVELRLGTRPLFRGTARPTLTVGAPTPVTLTLTPVVAALSCGPDVRLNRYGPAARLLGAALFATGDTVRDAPIAWSAPSNTIATVSSAGDVTALKDGDVQVTCNNSGFSGTRLIHVLAVVGRVDVGPPADTITVRNSVTLTPTLRDSSGNVITSPRPIAWTTSNASVATVNSSGVVTGVAPGVARIDATSGTASGSSRITVIPDPTVATTTATGITGTSATLNGTVNPNGTSTSAWFEWGTDPTLATAQSTPAQSLPVDTTGRAVAATISVLNVGTTYFFRIVASNSPGVLIRGTIVQFTTARPPTVTTNQATVGVTFSVAGTINPNGNATTAWFQIATAAGTLTPTVFTDTPHQDVGSGTTPITISQVLTVQAFTTYFVRAAASNVGGNAVGSLISFTTGGPPVLGTTSNSVVPCGGDNFCVQMSSSANPEGAPTDGWFEFGSDSTFKTFGSTAHQSLGTGALAVPFGATGPGISLSQAVFVRAVASNQFGTVRSVAIRAFAVVARVDVAPSADTITIRSSVTLTPTLRDSSGNVITSPRPIAWTTSNASVATVSSSGVVTGVAPGVARIDATSGTAVGSSQITVILPSPTVATTTATGIAGTSATLNGTVNPNGTSTSAWFEWGTDPTLATPQSTPAQSLPVDATGHAVAATISGLNVGTTYFFRIVASNSPGVLIRGTIVQFTTARPPTVTTNQAMVGGVTDTVAGTVNPNGSATTAWFQFATAPGTLDGPFTPTVFTDTPHQDVGSGTTPITISQVLTVQAFTTYFVRAAASNVGGNAVGSLISFTTGGPPVLDTTSHSLVSCGDSLCVHMSSSANPERAPTDGWFEFGSDSTFKTFKSTVHQSLGTGAVAVSFRETLVISLVQTVFFRAVASNPFGADTSAVIRTGCDANGNCGAALRLGGLWGSLNVPEPSPDRGIHRLDSARSHGVAAAGVRPVTILGHP